MGGLSNTSKLFGLFAFLVICFLLVGNLDQISAESKDSTAKNLLLFDQPLAEANIVKDLGVFLDTKLSFEYHIEKTVRKGLRNLGFLSRVTRNFTQKES